MSALLQVTYFDFADIQYASYFVTGLMAQARLGGFRFRVARRAPAPLLEAWARDPRWRGLLFAVSLFEAATDQGRFFFCVDARDSAHAGVELGDGYHLPLLHACRFYFKVNYRPEPIAADPYLRSAADRIHPLPLCFPVRPVSLLPFVSALLPRPALGWTFRRGRDRLRVLPRLPRLQALTALRTVPRQQDVLFLSRYYGEPAHHDDMLRRRELVCALRAEPGFAAIAGFTVGADAPPAFRELAQPGCALPAYLRRLAASRAALYLRGMFDCQSFKLGQLLALGLPVAGQPIRNSEAFFRPHAALAEQFCHETPAALLDGLRALLGDDARRARLGRENATLFDASFTPSAVAGEILRVLSPSGR